jgi:hypothetical protein
LRRGRGADVGRRQAGEHFAGNWNCEYHLGILFGEPARSSERTRRQPWLTIALRRANDFASDALGERRDVTHDG